MTHAVEQDFDDLAVLAWIDALEKKLLTYKVDITTLNPDKEGI